MAKYSSTLYVLFLISFFLFTSSTKIKLSNKLNSQLKNVDLESEKKLLEKVGKMTFNSPVGKLVYGDQVIRLRHVASGYYLQSHTRNYGESGVHEQEVTSIATPSESADWMIVFNGNPKNGDKLKLTHLQTLKNLHALGKVGQITKSQRTISAFGTNGLGNDCDWWSVEIAQSGSDGKLRVGTMIKLINNDVKVALHSNNVDYKYPGHHEVTGNKNRNTCDYWVVDIVYDPIEEAKKTETEGTKGTEIPNNATIRLMHIRTGFWLKSEPGNYPGGNLQGVTAINGKPPTTIWTIKTKDGNQPAEASVVRLTHFNTKKNLHMTDSKSSVTETDFLISGFGENGEGDAKDFWRLNLVQPRPSDKLTVGCIIRLISTEYDRTLHSYNKIFGGDNQHETSGYQGRDVFDLWMVDIAAPPAPPVTTMKLSGFIRNATNNKALSTSELNPSSVVFTVNGKDYTATVIANGSKYEVEIPKGSNVYRITTTANGFITATNTRTISEPSNESNSDNTILLSPKLDGWRVVLTWGRKIADLDLYLEYVGTREQIFWGNTRSKDGKVTLDIDVQSGGGPETITLSKVTSGKFRVFVNNYSQEAGLNVSEAQIKLYHGDKELEPVKINTTESRPIYAYWDALVFDAATGEVTVVNKVVTNIR